MSTYIDQHIDEFNSAITHLNDELKSLRIGRAHPGLVEDIMITAYGAKTPLKQLASIAAPEARSLTIQPWDKSVVKDIEKGLIEANIGINPVNEGDVIRLTVPQMTEETRKDLAKKIGEKVEQARIRVRQVRDKVKEAAVRAEKNNEVTEDDKFAILKKLDEKVKELNDQIKEIGDKKEAELMQI